MSLINQVLKDLDRQRGPAEDGHVAALQGVGLVQSETTLWPRIGIAVAMLTGVSLLGVFSYQFINRPGSAVLEQWEASTPSVIDEAVVDSVVPAVARQTSQPVLEPVVVAPAEEPTVASQPEESLPSANPQKVEPAEVVAIKTERVATSGVTATEKTETVSEKTPEPIKRMSPQQKAEQMFLRSQQAVERNELARAKDMLTRVLVEDPYHSDARLQLAGIMIAERREDLAEELLVTGLTLNPRENVLRNFYAQLQASRGDLQSALHLLNDASLDGNGNADSFGLRAAIHARLNEFDRSADDYQEALKLDPKRAEWWTGLGIALEHQARTDVAVRAYQRALALPLQDNLKAFAEQRLRLIAQSTHEGDG